MSKNLLTIEAFAEWCEKQPAEKTYDYIDCCGCACFQYLSAVGLPIRCVGTAFWFDTNGAEHMLPAGFNDAANGYHKSPRTFSALAACLSALSA